MIKIIAIDDNEAALHIIEKYAAKVSWITLIKTFTSPLQALDFLNDHPVDAVLIDVQMQDISGLEFIAIVSSVLKALIMYICIQNPWYIRHPLLVQAVRVMT